MANHAVYSQLPIMVRKPKMVWPGLIEAGKFRYSIAGDGNCLFASLSDQLYGDSTRHPEIRSRIVEHIRNSREYFEAHLYNDITQRRSTRSATAAPAQEGDDLFEEYLTIMARPGAYGGEPELVAFCQAFDQDVTVYLPKLPQFKKPAYVYTNKDRDKEPPSATLHIAFVGEDRGASGHYDSARSRDGSHPSISHSSAVEAPQIKTTPPPTSKVDALSDHPAANAEVIDCSTPTARDIRSGRSDMSHELIYDIIQKGKKEVEGSLDQLNPRARSSSVSSSHRSSSSKRSLDDEGENPRRKRADRRKSTRRRTDMSTVSYEYDNNDQVESPTNTPASTQDTETSSGVDDQDQSETDDDEYKPGQLSDSDNARTRKRKIIKPSSRLSSAKKSTAAEPDPAVKIAERALSTLRA